MKNFGSIEMQTYTAKPFEVEAIQVMEEFSVTNDNGETTYGKVGDYILYDDNDELYILNKAFFENTFAIVDICVGDTITVVKWLHNGDQSYIGELFTVTSIDGSLYKVDCNESCFWRDNLSLDTNKVEIRKVVEDFDK